MLYRKYLATDLYAVRVDKLLPFDHRNYISDQMLTVLGQAKDVQWSIEPKRKSHALVTTSQTLLFLCTLEQTMRLVGAAFWLVFRMSQYNNNPRVRTEILRTV